MVRFHVLAPVISLGFLTAGKDALLLGCLALAWGGEMGAASASLPSWLVSLLVLHHRNLSWVPMAGRTWDLNYPKYRNLRLDGNSKLLNFRNKRDRKIKGRKGESVRVEPWRIQRSCVLGV